MAIKLLGKSIALDESELKKILLKESRDNVSNMKKNYEHSLRIYFSEVGMYRLLTAQEEMILGSAIQNGSKLAFQCLVLGNLRLVVMIAQRYEDRDLDIEDVISEGNLGLMHATRKYDPQKGYRFSTYAVWWIRHYIEKAIMDQSRTIRLPIHINKILRKLKAAIQHLSGKLQRRPTIKELSEYTGLSVQEVTDYLAYPQSYINFDEYHDSKTHSAIEEEDHIDTISYLIESELFSLLEGVLLQLEPRERTVIEYRFGINGKSVQTLDKTGEILNLTRDQVRYLQTKTLEKIRLKLEESCGFELDDILD